MEKEGDGAKRRRRSETRNVRNRNVRNRNVINSMLALLWKSMKAAKAVQATNE